MITRFKIWFGLKLCDFGLWIYSLEVGDDEDERAREQLQATKRKIEKLGLEIEEVNR